MLTIRTTGEDAWDTDRRLLDALEGYMVEIEGDPRRWLIRGTNEEGRVLLRCVGADGQPLPGTHNLDLRDAANLTILVL